MMIDWDVTETKCVPSSPTEEIMDYLLSGMQDTLTHTRRQASGHREGTENCTGGGGTSQEGKRVSSLLHALMLSKLSFIMTHTELSVLAVDGVIVIKHGCHKVHTIASGCIHPSETKSVKNTKFNLTTNASCPLRSSSLRSQYTVASVYASPESIW